MRVGMVGLGRMGARIAEHLLDEKVHVVGFNRSPEVTRSLKHKGLDAAFSLRELCAKLPAPRAVFLMVPAGNPVDEMIDGLLPFISKGDVIIDGGNSHYADSKRRFNRLKKNDIHFLDCGTSGGLEGARHGACLTIGGEPSIFKANERLFALIAMPGGYLYCGPAGAGHYVKMVHNGIEYALLESYGEGFEVLEKAPYKKLDLEKISRVWSHGSVIRSWMTELSERAFAKDPRLKRIRGVVGGGETGRWTVSEAHARKASVPTIELALARRKLSQTKESFSAKVIAALRNEFGGHEVKKA